MHPRDRIQYRIGALKSAGLWRDPLASSAPLPEEGWVDARSNDYLGLARAVSRETTGVIGAGASRLISGSHLEHQALERSLADWLGFEECLLFSSGYAANVGAISALAGPGETILSDALNHASIIDGCRLSRAEVVVLPHRDLDAVERALEVTQGVRWVVTESYFGMDGDSPDLSALRRRCDAQGAALIVDEAHAIGVFGPQGRGLCAEQGVLPDVLVGGMGKALGIQGGFVCCSASFRDWLWNRARSLVFSTAPSPLLCSIALGRVNQAREAESDRARLRWLEHRLAQQLARAGVSCPEGRHGPLFPVILGSESAVMAGAARARDVGVLCHPIRPPTVPAGSSRLRVTLRADMSDGDVDRITQALAAAWTARSDEGPSLSPRGRDRIQSTGAATPEPGRAAPLASAGRPKALEPVGHAPAAATSCTPAPRRWVVLGTGTGVGKTFVARSVTRILAAAGEPVAGLKPIETGASASQPTDAALLEALAAHVTLPDPHPLYRFNEPVTPSRAARAAGIAIDLSRIVRWVETVAPTNGLRGHVVIETAGGVFSPLSDDTTNFELSAALDPATWILVAPNRLGVLHDVNSALHAMTARGRPPDWIILSAPEAPDASTPSNREELLRLRLLPTVTELPRNDPRPLAGVLRSMLEMLESAEPPAR